jgi:hypothetical protein
MSVTLRPLSRYFHLSSIIKLLLNLSIKLARTGPGLFNKKSMKYNELTCIFKKQGGPIKPALRYL